MEAGAPETFLPTTSSPRIGPRRHQIEPDLYRRIGLLDVLVEPRDFAIVGKAGLCWGQLRQALIDRDHQQPSSLQCDTILLAVSRASVYRSIRGQSPTRCWPPGVGGPDGPAVSEDPLLTAAPGRCKAWLLVTPGW